MKLTIEHYIASNNPGAAQQVIQKYGVPQAHDMHDLLRKVHAVVLKNKGAAMMDLASIDTPYRQLILSSLPPAATPNMITVTPQGNVTPAPMTNTEPAVPVTPVVIQPVTPPAATAPSAMPLVGEKKSGACGCQSGFDGEEKSNCSGCGGNCGKMSGADGPTDQKQTNTALVVFYGVLTFSAVIVIAKIMK